MRFGRLQFWFQSPLRWRVIPQDEYERMKVWQAHVDANPQHYPKDRLYLDAGGESVAVENVIFVLK